MSQVISAPLLCPLCHQPVTPDRFAARYNIEPAAQVYIQKQAADWQPENGACTNCLQETLSTLMQQVAANSHAPVAPVPFYGILPVGLRLGANAQFTGKGVTIAFLDSGFAPHPDLAGRVKLYVDASPQDVRELNEVEPSGILSWHGMMTSVVACGNGSLSDGFYRGLACDAEVVLIRVSDRNGRIREAGIERGLRWLKTNAKRYGVNIVNISLGGDKAYDIPKNPLDTLVESLTAQGILVVCAAGNGGARRLVPPASAISALTVGGLDDKNSLDRTMAEMWHSNYGPTQLGVWKPEVVAPGIWLAAPVLPGSEVAQEAEILQQLLSTPPDDLPDLLVKLLPLPITKLPADIAARPLSEMYALLREAWRGQKLITPYYQHVDGTSFAAPIASSVAAQMLQVNPGLSPAALKDLIMRTARYLPNVAPDQQGHGVVDPWAATAAVQSITAD